MKKTILSLVLLVMAMATSAQTIKTSFKKGDVRKYSVTMDNSIGLPMQGESKSTSTTLVSYRVTDATNGWTVEMKIDSFATNSNNELANQILGVDNYKALKGFPVRIKLDQKGYITDVLNADDVLAKQAQTIIATINSTYEKNPQLEKMVPKSQALMAANEQLTKENLLKYLRENSVLSLNGVDIKQNVPEDETVMELIKAKSTFTVSKNAAGETTVNKSSVSNMTDDDIKAFLKQQLSKAGSDDSQFDLIWGQLKQMGMAKVDFNSTATSTFDHSGWLKSSTTTSTTNAMGSAVKLNITTTLL